MIASRCFDSKAATQLGWPHDGTYEEDQMVMCEGPLRASRWTRTRSPSDPTRFPGKTGRQVADSFLIIHDLSADLSNTSY